MQVAILMAAVMCWLVHGTWHGAAFPTASGALAVGQGREAEDSARSARLAALRERARARTEQERSVFSESELADIETRYLSAHQNIFPLVRRPEGSAILTDAAIRLLKHGGTR